MGYIVIFMNHAERSLPRIQQERWLFPDQAIKEDYQAVYKEGNTLLGWPDGATRIFEHLVREKSVAIIGAELGDEGKGRIVDNKIEGLLDIPGTIGVYVVRYCGGGNAGHSVEKEDIKLALHQLPSGVLYAEVIGIMDAGMAVHVGNLREEVEMVEAKVGDTRGKLVLAENAILTTDLEEAEEILNRVLQGRAKGGTGYGIAPSYAHRLDRLGLSVDDLIANDWEKKFKDHYDRYELYFRAFGLNLADIEIPDFKETNSQKRAVSRTVGSREEFLSRTAVLRDWLISRDMVKNTFLLHQGLIRDLRYGLLFEGSQAIGLHPYLGTYPDVTSSDTSITGITTSTKVFKPSDIRDRIGVFKITYTSSVGARHLPTEVPLPKNLNDLPADASTQQLWAAWVRKTAHEYGTTTGRPRDILRLDLPLLQYNCNVGGIEVLAGTHLDIAQEDQPIQVCTHYRDSAGKTVSYQPGLKYQENVTPVFIELPGWDGQAVAQAKNVDELPENAVKFLAFIQRRTGFPIIAATTGPARKQLIAFPGYNY